MTSPLSITTGFCPIEVIKDEKIRARAVATKAKGMVQKAAEMTLTRVVMPSVSIELAIKISSMLQLYSIFQVDARQDSENVRL
jgi:hypothetical protein